MSAPPAKTELSDTYPNPSNAVMRTGMAKLWETLFGESGLLGATGNAPEARAALGAAADALVVKLAGNQTVAGIKTFSSPPIVPAATTSTQAINKGQVDTAISSGITSGIASAVSQSYGNGQTEQVLTGSRAFGTTYTNSTGKPITVYVYGYNSAVGAYTLSRNAGGVAFTINGSTAAAAGNDGISTSFVVIPGASYSVSVGNLTLGAWNELR